MLTFFSFLKGSCLEYCSFYCEELESKSIFSEPGIMLHLHCCNAKIVLIKKMRTMHPSRTQVLFNNVLL